MAKPIWHYAIVQSTFGDYWIGKTKLPLVEDVVFDNIQDAIDVAKELFESDHPEFDPSLFEDGEEGNDGELEMNYRDIIETSEGSVETISKKLEKRIVKSY